MLKAKLRLDSQKLEEGRGWFVFCGSSSHVNSEFLSDWIQNKNVVQPVKYK